MARKPIPGKDEGQWGQILNDFLDVSHTPDGRLRPGIVTESTLAPNVQGKLNGPSTPTTHSHAQSDVTGLVAALADKADTTHRHTSLDSGAATSGQVLTADGEGGTAWATSTGGGTPTLNAAGGVEHARINAFLAANTGKRCALVGDFIISAPIMAPAGTTLDATGATITLAPGSNCRMLQNSALAGSGARDTDIHISGGYWNRGANGGTTSNDQHSIVLHRADRVSVTDIRFTATGPCKYFVYLVDVNDAAVERLYYTSTSDGVHVTGPASRITVRDISGHGDDDIVSFTGRDYTSFELTAGGGDISGILVENIVCRGGVDPNTVKLLPGEGKTLSRAVVRNVSGAPATSAVILFSDTMQASTTGGIIDGVVIDGVTGTPGQRYVNVAHPDVRGLTIRNVVVTNNPTRAISLSGGGTITDVTIDGVTATAAMDQSLIHAGSPTTVGLLSVSNITMRSAGNAGLLLISDANIGALQMSTIKQTLGFSGLVISGGSCPLVAINGYHCTASNSMVRVSANVPVEIHATGITAYPSTMVTVLGATANVILRAGSIVDSANVQLARTGSQTLRAVGAGAKVNAGILTPVAGDVVHNTNAALGCGIGPVISTGPCGSICTRERRPKGQDYLSAKFPA